MALSQNFLRITPVNRENFVNILPINGVKLISFAWLQWVLMGTLAFGKGGIYPLNVIPIEENSSNF